MSGVLLKEDGYRLLLEDGNAILLETGGPATEVDQTPVVMTGSIQSGHAPSKAQPQTDMEGALQFVFTVTRLQPGLVVLASGQIDYTVTPPGIDFTATSTTEAETHGGFNLTSEPSVPPPGFDAPIKTAHRAFPLPFQLDRFGRPV